MPRRFRKLGLSDLDLEGRQLLLRSDLNVPLAAGEVGDDARILAALPAIRAAHRAGAAVVVASHLGRPGAASDAALSLRPVARCLEERLGATVRFRPEPVGTGTADAGAVPRLGPGETLLLENLRFHPGETGNDPAFGAALARFGDEYANDAFGAAHRRHASVDACARRFPRAAAGPLMLAELGALGRVLESPRRPFAAVLGGAKISDKLPVIRSLLRRADRTLIGGAMAYTFFAARGLPIGRSLVEPERVAEAAGLLRQYPGRLLLPTDHLTAPGPEAAEVRELPVGRIEDGWMGLDIGPASRGAFAAEIREAATVVWNGPMGRFENPRFAEGTNAVARAVAEASSRGAAAIVGGGDSLAAVGRAEVRGSIRHLSTGGGALLTLLAGKPLPGVEALADA